MKIKDILNNFKPFKRRKYKGPGRVSRRIGKEFHRKKSAIKAICETVSAIYEGGNVFGDNTERIDRENIQPTLQRYFLELKQVFPKANINPKNFVPVGSVGKTPTSGDIDLAIDATSMFPKGIEDSYQDWNITPPQFTERFDLLKKRARASSDEQVAVKAILQLISEYVNEHAPNIHMEPKKVQPGQAFGMFPQFDTQGNNLNVGVQIDWMVGHLPWLKFSYGSVTPPTEGQSQNVKGLHRTQLMLAMFNAQGYSFRHVYGVMNMETKEIEADTPDEALNLLNSLYDMNISVEELSSYHELHNAIKDHPMYEEVLDVYLKILDTSRTDVPEDMQEYWVNNQKKLGLTGKFLPDDSNLDQYRIT